MGNRIFFLFSIFLIFTAIIIVNIWKNSGRKVEIPIAKTTQEMLDIHQQEKIKREYVLEILGMGVTLDKHRQEKLWEVLQKGDPYSSVREQDPNKYLWSADDKDGIGGKRLDDALENGFSHSPMYWGVPSFYAGGPDKEGTIPQADKPVAGGVAGANLDFHLTITAPWSLAERPDRLVNEIFAFFDKYPDLPYIVITAEDSAGSRDMFRASDSPPLLRNGYYIPAMPDASAVFVLARRERVEPLRKFAWVDPDDNFLHDKLRWMWCSLGSDLPQPDRKTPSRTAAEVAADSSMSMSSDSVSRAISVSEWLEASAVFAKRADVINHGTVSNILHQHDFPIHRPPQGWKPTPWFPIPWTVEQLRKFDDLPSLGYLHRPTFVKMTDENGKPLEHREERQQALLAGWQQALQTLPEAERLQSPARMIAATNGNAEQTIALHRVLREHVANGGHKLDTGKSTEFIDTDQRLGNTGAATWFVQIAIGVMGSYLDGGVSAAVNLRDRSEASIIFVTPPSADNLKKQAQLDIFRSRVTPYIDPKNYQTPAIPTATR